jgi:hypothetical protein
MPLHYYSTSKTSLPLQNHLDSTANPAVSTDLLPHIPLPYLYIKKNGGATGKFKSHLAL